MNLPEGKGLFIWKIKDVCGGDPVRIAAQAVELGLGWAAVKICGGTTAYNLRQSGLFWVDDYIEQLAAAFYLAKIPLWGWGYVVGRDPRGEADIAAERVRKFNLAGYLVDAEAEYKVLVGRHEAAMRYMTWLRVGLPDTAIGFCSYRYPSLHPEMPWAEFLKMSDFHCPQVYWAESHNPAFQLQKSYDELMRLRNMPFIPAGSAYHENGWQPTLAELDEFDRKAREMGLPGLIWWEWGHAQRYGFIETIKAHGWGTPTPPPPPAVPGSVRVIAAILNIRSVPDTASVQSIVATTSTGKVIAVEDAVLDGQGRLWYQVGKGLYLAGWLCEKVG